jgi:hypothetical protein
MAQAGPKPEIGEQTMIATVPITGKNRELPSSLMHKLTRRGQYDPEVEFVRAEADCRKAADELRAAIDRKYAIDTAEEVKEDIRLELDATGALDSNGVEALRAEAEFYRAKLAEIEAAPVTIYDQAKAAVENGETEATLYKSSAERVSLYQYSSGLRLAYQKIDERGIVKKAVRVECGHLSPTRGWVWTLTRAEYTRWVARIEK